jgi:hypothetical protein
MKHRFALSTLALVACMSPDPVRNGGSESEIVFGVGVTRTPEGKTVTSAGWDILVLGGRGSTIAIYDERDRDCIVEDLATRVGNPRVDHGHATWKGGKLPGAGLEIWANQIDEPAMDGPGWASGDVLTFESTGFAAPDIAPVQLVAASAELVVKSPGADGPLGVPRSADFVATWEPGTPAPDDRIMVSFETDAKQQIRCFFDRSKGTGAIPRDRLQALPAGAKGTFALKTHRQVAGSAGGDAWTVYLVSTVTHREQSFTFTD